jgi:hypothetical protein
LFSPSEWRFEAKIEIIGKRRPAIQTRRNAALARLINNKVLTMSWLIFLALLLPASQDPQFPPIGIIDFYGLRSISERQVRESLGFPEDEITEAWERGDRSSFIEAAVKKAKAK